jgi:predicted nucleic acid-binding protein
MFQLYLDTSIISAYFDFHKPIRQLVTQKWFEVNAKDYQLFASTVVLEEIHKNTDQTLLVNMLQLLDAYAISILEVSEEIIHLAEAYRGHVLPQEINDTLHIALASYYSLDAIISWNFRHIVNLKTMKAIHDINLQQHYADIQILTIEQVGGAQYGNV